MTVKERIIERVEGMTDPEATALLQRLDKEFNAGSGLIAFLALADEIARNAPEEELDRIPHGG